MPSIVTRLRGFDAAHYAKSEQCAKQIEKLYETAAQELAAISQGASYNPNKVYSFNDLPKTRKQAQGIISRLVSKIQAVITSTTEREWLAATQKNDAFLGDILRTTRLTKDELEQYQDRNLAALATFQRRKISGNWNLSSAVWKYSGNFLNEMELSIDTALGEGTPAAELAREVRKLLNEPERIYRRFRVRNGVDDEGNPQYTRKWKRREYDPTTNKFKWVDDNPKDYHPGQGVYRSSVKNAMRLARTEINMAYRESEYLRWQQLDFVVGFRVCLSNNHTTLDKDGKAVKLVDMCDDLQGDYPKTFKFVGWHPNCRCYVVPIMKDYDEYNKERADRFKAIVRGEAYKSLPSRRQVTDVPLGFRNYCEQIADRAAGWKNTPYWIKDNFVGGTLAGGLNANIATKTMNTAQPCTDYDKEIAGLKQYAYAFGLDCSALDALRTAGDKTALGAEVKRLQRIYQDRVLDWVTARSKLRQFMDKELRGYDSLIAEAEAILTANDLTTKNYYATAIAKLEAAITDLRAKKATAIKIVESAKMPKALKVGDGYLADGDEPLSADFFDLLKVTPTLTIKNDNSTSYASGGLQVVIASKDRIAASPWYKRALLYHEFGHTIASQRRLTTTTELGDLRDKHTEALRQREKAVIVEYKREWDYDNHNWKYTKAKRTVNQMRAKTISQKIDSIISRLQSKSNTDPLFKRFGVTKSDVMEQLAAIQDTLKSLIISVGWGHSTRYFNQADHKQHEFLAHCFENAFQGNRLFRLYCPDLYADMVSYVQSLKTP